MNHHNLTPADQPTDTSSPEPSHTKDSSAEEVTR